MDFLTKDGLKAIHNHLYVPGTYTPLDNVLNPFWLWATDLLPMWLAPNLCADLARLSYVRLVELRVDAG